MVPSKTLAALSAVRTGPNHHAPRLGSWLNMAEVESSALCRQCLHRRVPGLRNMREGIATWETDRNERQSKTDWHFTTDDG